MKLAVAEVNDIPFKSSVVKNALAAIAITIVILAVATGCLRSKNPAESAPAGEHQTHSAAEKLADESKRSASSVYWTCPMHPQVESAHSGECPICHMKLVQVKRSDGDLRTHQDHVDHSAHQGQHDQRDGHEAHRMLDQGTPDHRAAVVVPSDNSGGDPKGEASDGLKLIGVRKTLVEKMDLIAHIPIAGRFISPTTVAFQVYETDLRYISSGLKFRGESSFKPEAELQGVITSVDSIVDPTSRTVRVVGILQNGPRGIVSETTFRGDLAIELKNVVSVPESAVLHTGQSDLVYLIHDGGHMVPSPVKLGIKTESYYQVLDGLKGGEMISSGPNFLIDSEAKIRGAAGRGHSHH